SPEPRRAVESTRRGTGPLAVGRRTIAKGLGHGWPSRREASAPMPQRRIFVSATTGDLESYRALASKILGERDYVVDYQEIFRLTYKEIGAKLKQRIADCDAVVCLIGFIYGGEPSHRPVDQPRRSYTQWEYYFARELGKPVFLLLADAKTKFDKP